MLYYKLYLLKCELREKSSEWCSKLFGAKSEGVDGILVTVGLCIIALLLCVVMKDQLKNFIEDLVGQMQEKAGDILSAPISTS